MTSRVLCTEGADSDVTVTLSKTYKREPVTIQLLDRKHLGKYNYREGSNMLHTMRDAGYRIPKHVLEEVAQCAVNQAFEK